MPNNVVGQAGTSSVSTADLSDKSKTEGSGDNYLTSESMDVLIMNALDDDWNAQNALAVGLANHGTAVALPNLIDPTTGENVTINAADALDASELNAVARSGANTETRDQALTIMQQKIDAFARQVIKDQKA